MGIVRRVGPDVGWILFAVVSGAVYFGWASSFTWLQGALAGLAWGSLLVLGRRVRRRRDASPSRSAPGAGAGAGENGGAGDPGRAVRSRQ